MESPRPHRSEAGWFSEAGRRLRAAWMIKLFGMVGGMTGFFVGYFWLLQHPQFPVRIMPLTKIDELIAFQPGALPLYLSLWIYVALSPALVHERRMLGAFGIGAVTLAAIGLGIFFRWPTAVPRVDIDWSLHPGMEFLKSADMAGNACPSLHVAFAVFSACWFERLLREIGVGRAARIANWLWCVGILYSTVAVRQHVVWDVVAGAALGAVVAVPSVWWPGLSRAGTTTHTS